MPRDTLVLSKSRWLVDGYSCFLFLVFSPDSDIAIGVLTSKKGGGRRTTLADWTWHQAGAIVGCHCSVLWLGGRVTTNFRGVDVVPLLAFAGCHCSVLWWGKGRVTTNFGGVGVPLHGAHGTLHSNGIQKMHPEKLPWASCRRYTVLYIDDTKLVFACFCGSIVHSRCCRISSNNSLFANSSWLSLTAEHQIAYSIRLDYDFCNPDILTRPPDIQKNGSPSGILKNMVVKGDE